MKSIAKLHPKSGLSLIDADIPTVGSHDVLIKIKKTGICGTDLHLYQYDDWAKHTIKLPLIIGHEFVGEIVKTGQFVSQFSVGMRVTGEAHITCQSCIACRSGKRHLCQKSQGLGIHRQGAFAQYLSLPAENVWPLSDDISFTTGSYMDAFGNAVHAVSYTDIQDKDVVISGAGPIGLMTLLVCRFLGAYRIVISDLNPFRLRLARKLGADATFLAPQDSLGSAQKILHISDGFDYGFEMSGSQSAFSDMLDCLKPGAKAILLGLLPNDCQLNWSDLIFKSICLQSVYGRHIFDTWEQMAALFQKGLDPSLIVTHEFSYQDFEKAFQLMSSKRCGKIILNWDADHA